MFVKIRQLSDAGLRLSPLQLPCTVDTRKAKGRGFEYRCRGILIFNPHSNDEISPNYAKD